MSAATTVTETASCWTMGEECVCVQSISYSLLCRWFKVAVLPLDAALCAEITKGRDEIKRCAVCGGGVYAQLQPGQILPGLRGAGTPEERGGAPTKKIPPVYAFRAVKVHGNQGFFRMVGRQVDKVIQFPSKRGSKCGKMDKKEAPGQRQLFRSLSRLNDFGMDTDFVQCYN